MEIKKKMVETKEKVKAWAKDHKKTIINEAEVMGMYALGFVLGGATIYMKYRGPIKNCQAIDEHIDTDVDYDIWSVDPKVCNTKHPWVYIISKDDHTELTSKMKESES